MDALSKLRESALQSLCMYAAVGIVFDFLFQITFFVACLKLDCDRISSNRYDAFCCFK